MDTREVAAEYRLAQWAQTIQARVQSGQSIKEFCVSSGSAEMHTFYWQRKLRETACSEIQEAITIVKSEDSLVSGGWMRLEAVEPACRCQRRDFETPIVVKTRLFPSYYWNVVT